MYQINSKKTHSNMTLIGLSLIFIGIFLFPFLIRQQFAFSILHTTIYYLWAVNFISLFGFIIIVFNTPYLRKDTILWSIPIMASIFPLFYSTKSIYPSITSSFGEGFLIFVCCIVPIFLIFVKLNSCSMQRIFPYLFLILNTILILVAIGAILDLVFDRIVIRWFATFMTFPEEFAMFANPTNDETSRYYSMFGHPLKTANLCCIFYALNVIGEKNKVRFSLPSICSFLITGIIIAATASKTGIVVMLVITIIAYHRNIKMLLLFLASGILLSFTGIFNNLISRFLMGNLTTGRNEKALALFADSNFPFHFFLWIRCKNFGLKHWV